MKILNSKYPLIGFMFYLLLLHFSCKQETNETKPDYTGQTIKAIESNIIKLEGGEQITINEDSIAKVYYLVRHAEKDTSIEVEPPLTEAGIQRATKIADIMRGTRVDAIYSTMTIRTMFTVDSLTDIKAMKILPYENKGLKMLLDDIQSSKDFNRIFIVGHSNTIPSITNTLAGKQVFSKTFDDNDYGNFVIVVQNKSGSKDAFALRY